MERSYTGAEALRAEIVAVMAQFPHWGVRKVWARLRQPSCGMRVSTRRVWKTMRMLRQARHEGGDKNEQSPTRVAVDESNSRWATDFTTAWTERDGRVTIVPTIDCGCRTVVSLAIIRSQSADDILASVEQALTREFGSPATVSGKLELRTDQGAQYTSQKCKILMDKWGINHTFAKRGNPTGNAVVERVIRTMKEECIWPKDWQTIEELREALNRWCREYNEERPHQSLKWSTPEQRRQENLAAAKAKEHNSP